MKKWILMVPQPGWVAARSVQQGQVNDAPLPRRAGRERYLMGLAILDRFGSPQMDADLVLGEAVALLQLAFELLATKKSALAQQCAEIFP